MRHLFIILFLLCATTSFCQTEEIYKLTFADPSNFEITTHLGHTRPVKYFIIDTTDTWRTERFWLDELNERSTSVMKQMEEDEHHPYNHTYVFRDTALDQLINDEEKRLLKKKAGLLASKRITFKGKNYLTIPSAGEIKGFYFVTTEPVFTLNRNYAFVDITVFYKDKLNQDLRDTYFGTICIVYEKKHDNKWKKLKLQYHLIL